MTALHWRAQGPDDCLYVLEGLPNGYRARIERPVCIEGWHLEVSPPNADFAPVGVMPTREDAARRALTIAEGRMPLRGD